MRKRYYLSFDMDDPRHREAEALFAGQASRQRTEYVVTSILTANQTECLEQAVRQTIREELKQISLQSNYMQPEEVEAGVQLTDLPGSLLHALDDL